MTSYEVFLIADAEEDLFSIFRFYSLNNMREKGKALVTELKEVCESLKKLPHRGHVPRELERVGVFEYKEINHQSYRIIYQVMESDVYIHAVLDGRRDLQSLLENRLFRP